MRGETPASATDSLDAAKRDLRDLPAAERSQEVLGKSSSLGSASLPALALPNSGAVSQSKPDPDAPPSPTWLQDALKQTDAEKDQRRQGPDASLVRDQANGYKPVRAPDPLAQYLGQWMTPRDRELLRPEAKNVADQKAGTPLDLNGQTPDKPGVLAPQLESLALPMQEPARNPYLPETETPPPAPNPFATVSTAQSNERAREPFSLPPATPALPNAQPVSPKPASSPIEPAVSPTAPIVDDRKYFPQLHRF